MDDPRLQPRAGIPPGERSAGVRQAPLPDSVRRDRQEVGPLRGGGFGGKRRVRAADQADVDGDHVDGRRASLTGAATLKGSPYTRGWRAAAPTGCATEIRGGRDRKSTRLNSSHVSISYAVFCFKKKNRPSDSTRVASAQARLCSCS